ncbi:MAG: SocA family protein [Betaproteobacteria bacterium]|nr:SocA family protein [Betaproteobacteria bacterium]
MTKPSVVEKFEPLKAVAALAYLWKGSKGTTYTLLKMLYLADRYHLERYARTITGDIYVAMDQGPVASGAYDILKCARGKELPPEISEIARRHFRVDADHRLALLEEPDFDELSDSDVHALQHAVSTFDFLGSAEVRHLSHDKAWRIVRQRGGNGGNAPLMDLLTIAGTLRDGEALAAHLADSQPGEAVG